MGFFFLTFASTFLLFVLLIVILTGVRWNLNVVLICISFRTRDVEYFFTYLNFLLWKLSVQFMCKGLLIIQEGLFQIRRDTGKWCLSAISSFLKDIYTFSLSIHPLIDTLTNSIIRQLQMVLQWMWRYLYSSLFSFFWIRVWDWYSQIIL
jgi:hypothetical protein